MTTEQPEEGRTESTDEQVHVPPPTCPYCRAVLHREADLSAVAAGAHGSASFACPNGCGTFTDFDGHRTHALGQQG